MLGSHLGRTCVWPFAPSATRERGAEFWVPRENAEEAASLRRAYPKNEPEDAGGGAAFNICNYLGRVSDVIGLRWLLCLVIRWGMGERC